MILKHGCSHLYNSLNLTKRDLSIVLQAIAAVGEAIKSLGSIPSGHLYAQLMGHMDLERYTSIINILKNAELVKEDGFHMLTWIGPIVG